MDSINNLENQPFDPMADLDFDFDAEVLNYVPPIEKPDDYDDDPSEDAEIPVEERIAKLFKGMPGNEKLLMHVIDYCREAKDSEDVYQEINDFLNGRICTYSPEILCANLNNAGALNIIEYEDEETIVEEQSDLQANEDAYEIIQPPKFQYLATSEAVAFIEESDPESELQAFLDENSKYEPVIQAVLNACSQEGGASKKVLDDIVDDHPLCQNPRRRSGFFLKNLEAHDALVYADGWKTTDLGKSLLNQ